MAQVLVASPAIRTISLDDATRKFASLLDEIVERGEEVIVERDDRPTAVILSFTTYEEVLRLRQRDEQQRAAALARLMALREHVRARNQDLTDEEVEELTSRAVHEVIDDMTREGLLRFERDLQP